LGGTEEGVGFNIRSSSSSAKSAVFILDEKFPNQGLAQTVNVLASQIQVTGFFSTYLEICGVPECSGNGTSSLRILANVALRFFPLKGVVPYNIS
jgi:hypothetical protein